MSLKILILPGDGIGPEIIATAKQALEVLDAKLGLGLEINTKPIGFDALKETGATWSTDIEDACRKADGVIMGPTDTAAYPSPEEGELGPQRLQERIWICLQTFGLAGLLSVRRL